MLAEVTGRVGALRLDAAVVVVGGMGLLVRATPGTLAGLRVGEQARLATSLVVREDSLTLYGFADDDEREAFEVLQTVSGVGPRLALAMLAVHSPDALRRAVATQDLTALTRVPGIGRKGAQRIALELGDRLGPPADRSGEPEAGDAELLTGPRAAPGGQDTVPSGGVGGQVVEALVGLGWPARQAEDATAAALAASREDPAAGEPVAAIVLRAALRSLARS